MGSPWTGSGELFSETGEFMKRESGFTLIELMIVVAIIAVLAAIALPAYQDYVARAQVAEGMGLSTGAKIAIATYYGDFGQFPPDNAAAGMSQPGSISARNVRSVTVDRTGTINVAFSSSASAKLHDQTLTLTASDNDGSLSWACDGLPDRYMPASCR